MKLAVFFFAAISCLLGMAFAMYGGDYTYVPVTGYGSGASSGGLLPLIGLLFIIFFLFGFGNNRTNQDQIILFNTTG